MAVRSTTLTYSDLLHERELRDERQRLELIDGEIVVTPAPAPMHQLVVHRLAVLLDRAIVEPDLGLVLESPIDVFLEIRNVFQPDVIVLLHDRLHLFGAAKVESAPSLAIEIISPSTGRRDRVTKRDIYARYGVPEYWLVDHELGTLIVFSDPRDGHYQTETTTSDIAVSATIPGLTVDQAALFAPVRGA
jgi:Uma2 family endonuclease